jgi:hypothetical protein
MVDNLKSAVLQRLAGVAPVFNPRYLDFARHHGFEIVACNVGRGNEKGRVESGVGYVKKNFLRGLELSEFSAIQAAAQVWLDTVANVRIHGEPNGDLSIYLLKSVHVYDDPIHIPTTLAALQPRSRPVSSASPWTPITIPYPAPMLIVD